MLGSLGSSNPGLSRPLLKNLGFLGFFKKPEKLGF